MPNRILTSEFLGPEDLALCQRVFQQIIADSRVDRTSIDAELVASAVLAAFRRLPVSEAELLAAMRSRNTEFLRLIS